MTPDRHPYVAVGGFQVVCAVTFHLSSFLYFLLVLADAADDSSSASSSVSSSGSKVLLDLADRERYVVRFGGTCLRVCLGVIWLFVCRGDTALHKAASEKLHAVCRLLVEAGASLKKTNFQVVTGSYLTHTPFPVSPANCLR